LPFSAFRKIISVNWVVFTTSITVTTINGARISIIARDSDVLTTEIWIARVYSTSVVIITADRGIVATVILAT